MNTIRKNYIFSPFLIDPKYRIWRLILIAIIGLIITFNMVFVAYQDCSKLLGNRVYLIAVSTFLLYAVAMLFNYYYLIPRFLLKGKYILYSVFLVVVVFLLPMASVLQEYWVRNTWDLPHRITSYANPLILVDNLALCMLVLICFFGMSALALLRSWIERKEHLNRMEQEHLLSEINELKGQVTPAFLSKTLTNASLLVKTNPRKATEMLMQLGLLLRYQLYDCNREKVLLKSEISFLENFLRIEQINKEELVYSVETKGDINNTFISPLLFISLIQNMIENSSIIKLFFSLEDQSLLFRYESDNERKMDEDEAYTIKRRLDLIYPDKYTLLLETGIIELRIDTSV
ncbi:hypothetical protein M2459_002391 [Parabacteroides sp. PF5-5]|uniref:sensor histidine kinase n=1 Tax=unclassified Parabacteroides TaxID=2649774 RepID=UPI002474F0BF|nr:MULTISPECIES: sensor histidine kinase [unclassified Parabacteroides]MDH6305291.1 hypothetical protein [Parabacteroides sp. PH5-39]MDH6316644.1 hypothetical protein [Parabacteroides sp. PF5-13]MDH6320176.1 hypothetical protein [Parabacteroides sp. PH5-13]MDH6323881.1 hypothetical protein [Parabacteroides sp. PH5-8]MDH6327853.1 hypothetical protein [Parabacteroides sp. PH5-41]